jgi:hypothetical protein
VPIIAKSPYCAPVTNVAVSAKTWKFWVPAIKFIALMPRVTIVNGAAAYSEMFSLILNSKIYEKTNVGA